MILLRLTLVLVTTAMASNMVEGCQPELVEDASSLVTVGYDRQGTTAVYVDTLSVEMKKKKKFKQLLAPGCSGRREVTVAIEMRKEGEEEWKEIKSDIKITARDYDDMKDLDPCSRYEIKVLIKPINGGQERELEIFKVGPFHELDAEDTAIAKFKGDGEQYYTDHFKAEYLEVTDKSFTVKWEPICALGINVFVKGEDQDWNDDLLKKITNDVSKPTTQLTFDVTPCTAYEVGFEFFIDSEGQELVEQESPLFTSTIEKNDLRDKFSKYSFDNATRKLKWNYMDIIDELECMESFSYTLVKDENGDIEQMLAGDDQDSNEKEYDFGTIESECNFGVRMEVEYNFFEETLDSFIAFEEPVHNEDQMDNAISAEGGNIYFVINPCIQASADIVIGLAEIGAEVKELSGVISEENLVGQVDVDESSTAIPWSSFNEKGLKSCATYKILLLRRSNEYFKELETAEFKNPRWDSWKAPSLLVEDKSETSITLNITDLETEGECPVSQYDVSCYEVGVDAAAEKKVSENLKLENLMPETTYNCTARIVHMVSGSGRFETPWTDVVLIETAAIPSTSLPELDSVRFGDGVSEPGTGASTQALEGSAKASSGVISVASFTLLVISVILS